MIYAESLNPVDNPRLLVDIVGSDDGCAIFAAFCNAGAAWFARGAGLEVVTADRTTILSNDDLFFGELAAVGETGEAFLAAAALYRFVCIAQPFSLVRAGPGPFIHPVVTEHTNAAAGFRLCYELGQAISTRGFGTAEWVGLERHTYEYSNHLLVAQPPARAEDVALSFLEIFSGRLGVA